MYIQEGGLDQNPQKSKEKGKSENKENDKQPN
jgi:hypothetical protein